MKPAACHNSMDWNQAWKEMMLARPSAARRSKFWDARARSFAGQVSKNFQSIARRNFKKAGLSRRIRIVEGDVHAMPFENWYVDLIVSRGSMFFWKNLMAAFSEILRVLKPGGAH